MAVKVGDVVHNLYWDTLSGTTVDEYEVVAIEPTQIRLKHLASYRNKTRYEGHGQIETRSTNYLALFDIPIADRLSENREFVEWLVGEFKKPA